MNTPDEVSNALQTIKNIDERSTTLQKQGNYMEALKWMERGLVLRQRFLGSDSDQILGACKVMGEMYNLLAMRYLQQDKIQLVLELLQKAEILAEHHPVGRAVTFNNLACYYRRLGKPRIALQYTQKALKIEARLVRNNYYPADTYLNACAVLSQLGRHQSALYHGQKALTLLQEELFKGFDSSIPNEALENDNKDGKQVPVKLERIAVLAIAYHNIGVEQEFLKRVDQSLQSYQKGKDISEQYLGRDHATTATLRKSFLAAQGAASTKDRIHGGKDK